MTLLDKSGKSWFLVKLIERLQFGVSKQKATVITREKHVVLKKMCIEMSPGICKIFAFAKMILFWNCKFFDD